MPISQREADAIDDFLAIFEGDDGTSNDRISDIDSAASDAVMRDAAPTGVCGDFAMPGHTEVVHECQDFAHDTNQSTTSCAKCIAAANVHIGDSNIATFNGGAVLHYYPGCHLAFIAAEGEDKDYACNCQGLPRCSTCHFATVMKFVAKAAEIEKAGMGGRCKWCKGTLIEGEEIVVRCGVCFGMKP